jgi:hypothetical protein
MPSLPYPGPDSGTLIFQCNDRNHSNQTINLAGKGVDPRFCIDPSTSISNPWVFGPLYLYDTSVPKQIKIWNCGSGVLIINDWDFNQVGIPDSWIVDNWVDGISGIPASAHTVPVRRIYLYRSVYADA